MYFELEVLYVCFFVCVLVGVCACVQWYVGEDAWVRMSVCGVCLCTQLKERERDTIVRPWCKKLGKC